MQAFKASSFTSTRSVAFSSSYAPSQRRCCLRIMANTGDQWKENLITKDEDIVQLARSAKRVAVLGIKTEKKAETPAFFVAEFLQKAGVKIVPVPIFFPECTEILGEKVFRRVQDVPESQELDIVDVFRKPSDIPAHMEDLLAAKPKAVWFQSGIRNDECAEHLARAGIKVVQDKCLKVEYGIQR
mmetsp:Transcript_28825/g.48401  ORF Transcript_28825/g.48401 Transcript_28825/m.48401 type:complete len:185 (+) Transcript_28825:85-639(+)